MPGPALMILSCLLWLVTIAVMDLRIRKVRNWMVLLGIGMGLVMLVGNAQPFQVPPWKALFGMLAAFSALLPFYAMRWMGAGDVKFAAVIGLWFGLSPALLAVWVGGSLLAGVHGVLVLAWRRARATPTASWLQARLPLPLATALVPHEPAAAAPDRPRTIERSIPYAGYMALTAIWLVLTDQVEFFT